LPLSEPSTVQAAGPIASDEPSAVTYLDLYCERLGPGLLAEPLNALTNAAFFLAAWLALESARSRGLGSLQLRILLALAVAIGIGSTLFHTFATPWARALDESPILLFQLLFMWMYLRQGAGTPRWITAGCIVGYLAGALYCRQFPHLLNGSLVYAPALALTASLGVYHWRRRKPEPWLLLGASVTLVGAVFLRTLDAAVCDRFPIGTHFLWHLLVAGVIYLSVRALIVGWLPSRGHA
jgi:hypothetical protein